MIQSGAALQRSKPVADVRRVASNSRPAARLPAPATVVSLSRSALLLDSADTSAPRITRVSQGDEGGSLSLTSNITVTFSEAIRTGSGHITLRKASGELVETFNVEDSDSLAISNNQLTINPTANLENGVRYEVSFNEGVITDLRGNVQAGTSSYKFAAKADKTAPKTVSFNPSDGATGVSPSTKIVVTFSETIRAGTGKILLKDSRGRLVQSFSASSATISGNTLTLNPGFKLSLNSKYSVVFSSGSVKDLAGNVYKGTSSYDFKTAATDIPYTPPGGSNSSVSYSDNPQDNSRFNIALSYTGDSAYLTYFQQARSLWENVITGDLPTANGIDDLQITASVSSIDGAGGVLGQASPSSLRASSRLPVAGSMQFDSADVAGMVSNGTFLRVVLHEMGHVLGIGSLWSSFGLNTTLGRYTGAHGIATYRSMSGGNSSATYVPLETTGGSGTQNVHWSESTFNSELMTGYAETGSMPLSVLTIAALHDLGYQVNYSAAETYSVGQLLAPSSLLATA